MTVENMQTNQHRTRLAVGVEPAEGGGFEILAISAGEGNGWQFGADVLQSSLPLWDGVETFIDHTPSAAARRSLRDLPGYARSRATTRP